MAESQKTEPVYSFSPDEEKRLKSLSFWAILWKFRGAYFRGVATLFVVDAANVAMPTPTVSPSDAPRAPKMRANEVIARGTRPP